MSRAAQDAAVRLTSHTRTTTDRMELLHRFFSPRGVVVVGASNRPRAVSRNFLAALRRHGFPGGVYAVNPKYRELEGCPCVAHLADIPEPMDAAIVALPAPQIPDALRECANAGIAGAVVYASGFAEVGGEGGNAEAELTEIARSMGIVLLGPNGPGFVNFHAHCCAMAGNFSYRANQIAGDVGAVIQSGGVAGIFAERAQDRGIGLSYLMCSGNEADFTAAEAIQYLVRDDATRAIAVFLEGISDGPALEDAFRAAHRASKPIVILKGGSSEAGQVAASLHTGSLVGSDKTFSGLCRQYGVERVDNIDELFDVAAGLARLTTDASRIGVLTTSGGGGVMMVDELDRAQFELPALDDETRERLRLLLPSYASLRNPTDMTGIFLEHPHVFREAITILCEAPDMDAVLVVLTAQRKEFALKLAELATDIPAAEGRLLIMWYSGNMADEARARLRRAGVAVAETPRAAARVLAARRRFAHVEPPRKAEEPSGDLRARHEPSHLGDILECLKNHGVQMPPFIFSDNTERTAELSSNVPGPWAVKTASLHILHKSDQGAVRLGITDRAELGAIHREVATAAIAAGGDATVIVQSMTDVELELILAARRDPAFGWTAVLGLGGILTELHRRTTVRLAPLTEHDVEDMLHELGLERLLAGFRSAHAIDPAKVAHLANSLVAYGSAFASLQAVEVNPVALAPSGELLALDVALGWTHP